jgi:hypothetical protein
MPKLLMSARRVEVQPARTVVRLTAARRNQIAMILRILFALALIPTLPAAELRPLRVAVLLDQTGSTTSTRVPRLEPADFSDLLDRVLMSGGEIAVGAIRDRSNRPLLRCRVEQKPERRAQAPAEKMNPFLKQKLMRTYVLDKSKEDQIEAAWKEQAQTQVEIFREKLREVLDAPLAGRTDVNGAVLRADLFLAEPDDGWRQPTFRFALFHSDGMDNVREPVASMRSGATVLVVNGSASLGALSALKPVAFESFGAAIRYIRSHSKEE